jgi:hypothetical protein
MRLSQITCRFVAIALCASNGGSLVAEEERVLLNFDRDFDAAKVEARDVKVSLAPGGAGQALHIASGHQQEWPGITLPAPAAEKRWDLSPNSYLALDVKNVGANEVTVCCRVDNPGADGVKNCSTGSVTLAPGAAGVLKVTFSRAGKLTNIKLFGMRGYPGGAESGGALDPANVTQLLVFVPKPKADHAFEINNIRAGGTYAAPAEKLNDPKVFFPFIDTFGQYVHRDWPGKTHSVEELKGRIESEAKEWAEKPGPASWDAWGGWKDGPTLLSTGFFRVEKHEGKWWLVDPDGKLFWSHGIDCVNNHIATPIEERKEWFQDFPGDQPEFKKFLGKEYALHGHYKGRTVQSFNFGPANLMRKYGDDWFNKFSEATHKRLRSWGMNTIANWSDAKIYLQRKTPYVATVHFNSKPIRGSTGYWGQFKDPFEAEFKTKLQSSLKGQAGKAAKDPWCVGFFVDNEIAWNDDVSLAVAALMSPADQACKKVFLEDLKARYGEIEKLNAGWVTSHASWDALLDSTQAPDKKKARADLTAFYTRIAEQYFMVVKECVKEVAPDQLYLGCRFAWVNDLAAKAGAKYCDVVSYNLYRDDIAGFRMPGNLDVPLIVGEFHFGALDRGMFHTGLVSLASQADRAKTYKSYVTGALKHPQFVGTHWFQYVDEATTGRCLDEENYQIGFLDSVDTPYPETIQACREVGYGMYETRMGKK